MDTTTNAVTANTGTADAFAVRLLAPASHVVADCASWERSHASTSVMTTGGVRLLPGITGRLRSADYGTPSFPSSGPSTQRPPV